MSRVRGVYHSPGFWIVFLVVVTALVVIRIVQLDSRTTRDETYRRAEIASAYDACLRSIPLMRRVDAFVEGVQELHSALLENALATHAATPATDPAYAAQIANLRRLKRAREKVRGVHFTVPTRRLCADEREARIRVRPLQATAPSRSDT